MIGRSLGRMESSTLYIMIGHSLGRMESSTLYIMIGHSLGRMQTSIKKYLQWNPVHKEVYATLYLYLQVHP